MLKIVSHWSILNALLEQEALPYEVYAVAKLLVENEASAAFICHLLLSTQHGHLCISVKPGFITPSIDDIWLGEPHQKSALDPLLLKLSALIPEGVQNLSGSLPHVIYQKDCSYYLQKHWQQETLWIDCVKKALTFPQPWGNQHAIEHEISHMLLSQKLLPEQAQAVLKAAQQNLLLICGGPGTGKTYTAGQLIKILWNHLPIDKQKAFQIALAAPTGKAASNLQNSLAKATEDLANWKIPKAKTLHALLQITPYKYTKKRSFSPLAADLILVDESSMIDLPMMIQLFSSLKPSAKLILLGDHHQLPAVGIGSPFRDLRAYMQSKPEYADQVIELKTCLRAELKGILEFAEAVKRGDTANALSLLENEHSQGIEKVYFDEKISLSHFYSFFLEKTASLFSFGNITHTPPEDLLRMFNRFRILSPLRKGPLGIEALNHLLLEKFMQNHPPTSPFVAPILLIKNDHQAELYNGEIGVLVRLRKSEGLQAGDYALFPAKATDGSGTIRRIPALLLPQFEYAYCLSVHKSQGSEFDQILLMLPVGSEVFGREVLYTAVTRAKKHLQVWTNPNTLSQTLKRASNRLSSFVERMDDLAEQSQLSHPELLAYDSARG
ncbi:exodeoxyribonuclease V subunit alpha [Parachlamydia sp. AcF125]|uniref:exodeoxyribonuclease V subunit alpha n=1 Tax=Parachlamydia sp. AcF125 TaxID=2795736 RepID=UPI001BC929BC|nr:exodeoxyribonuclease V subunit alpha [Parachlamydia sp. AcF125]MBS4167838.1 RecBCD enzyme subunit RecD [Parachlamydia sp. AcF125]